MKRPRLTGWDFVDWFFNEQIDRRTLPVVLAAITARGAENIAVKKYHDDCGGCLMVVCAEAALGSKLEPFTEPNIASALGTDAETVLKIMKIWDEGTLEDREAFVERRRLQLEEIHRQQDLAAKVSMIQQDVPVFRIRAYKQKHRE